MKFLIFLFFFIVFSFPAYATKPVQEVVSQQGIKAWLIEDHTLPLLSMRFSFSGGVEMDPKDKQGLALLTASLMTQGAGPYDAIAFQDRLAASSISLSISAGRDVIEGGLKTLSKTQEEAFHLLALMLTEPRLAQADFLRLRDQQLVGLRFQISDPLWQARYALFSHLFEGHPYGFRSVGTRETLFSITRQDVIAFVKARFVKENLLVTVVGAISPQELAQKLDDVFGALPEKGKDTLLSQVKFPEKTKIICVPREGKQTNIIFAAPMIRRDNPDWYAASLANYILGGGGFESRLMQDVREREGLTYGVSTELASMDKASLLIGSFSAEKTRAGEALMLVKKVWRTLFEQGVSEEEVRAAKAYLIGAWPLNMISTDSIAATLLSLRQENLEIDYLKKRKQLFQNVSRHDVNRVLRAYFNPTKVSIAAVGNAENISCDITQDQAGE